MAQMYKNDIKQFNAKAAEWTESYAKEVTPEDKVAHIMEMGFEEEVARDALARYDFDENMAINFLLGG